MSESARPVVCVVDDDLGIRESLHVLFEDAGYEVEEVGDGEAALSLLRADVRPRVMLLDRMMSRLDGVQTLRQFRQEPALLRRTVILFMTARNDPPDPETATRIHHVCCATVAKPFNLDTLLDITERACEQLGAQSMVR